MRRRPLAIPAWILATAATVLATAAGCGQPVATFAVDPGSAMPAAPIVLEGLKIPAAKRDGVAVTIGKTTALFNYRSDGTLVAVVPSYMSGSSWPAVPTKPQTVKVYRKGSLIAQSANPLRVLPLQRAPGTTRQLAKNLDAIAASFDGLNADFPPANADVADFQQALSEILHAAGSGGENSVSAFADGTAPLLGGKTVNLDLVDAVLASSGVAPMVQKLANDLASFRSHPLLPSPVCNFQSEDRLVACTMQFQVWIERILRDDVGEFLDDAGPALAIVAVIFPETAIPIALVEIVNTITSKLYPTAFPSKFESFQVALGRPVLVPTAWTQAMFRLTVTNEPGSLGPGDILKMLVATLEIIVPETEAADLLPQTGSATTQIVNGVVNALAKVFKGCFDWLKKQVAAQALDKVWGNNAFTVPTFKVGPFAVDPQHPELLTLKEKDSSVVSSIAKTAQVLDWGAHDVGTTTVQAWPKDPDTATQLFEPPFAAQKVGSFGHASAGSNQPTVVVATGKVTYDVGNHGSHEAQGTDESAAAAPGAGGTATPTGPNQVWAYMEQKAWTVAGEGADKSLLEFTCLTTPFSQLGTSIQLGNGQTPCNGQWYDDFYNPTYIGVTTSGVLSFDTCRVLSSLKGQPFKVLFTGSYGGLFEVQTMGTTKKESDSFSGKFTAVFEMGFAYQTDPAVLKAIEDQCDNWPVAP